jgi:tetratricopeptide (TPR) repeat protein
MEQASKFLRSAIEIDPTRDGIRLRLAGAEKELGNLKSALAELEILKGRRPGWLLARLELGSLNLLMQRIPEAAQELSQAIRIDPTNPEAHLLLGKAQVRLGKMEEAAGNFETALKYDPGNTEAANDYTRARRALGLADSAVPALAGTKPAPARSGGSRPSSSGASARESRSARALYDQGVNLIRRGKYAEAVPPLEKLLRSDPDHQSGRIQLATALIRVDNRERAKTELRKAIEDDPKNPIPHRLMGEVYLNEKSTGMAVDELETAVRLDPNSVDAHLLLGMALRAGGDPMQMGQAVRHLSRAAEARPKDAGIMYALGLAYAGLGDLGNAEASLGKALELNPNQAGARAELGRVKSRQANAAPAAPKPARSTAESSDNPGMHIRLAQTYLELKRPGDAWKEFTKARDLGYEEEDSYVLGARILSALGRDREAMRWLNMADARNQEAQALKSRLQDGANETGATADNAQPKYDPAESAQAAYRRGLAAEKAKRFPAAASAYERAIEASPNSYAALVGLGRTRFHLKQYDQAIEVLNRAVKIRADDAELFNCMGSCYYRLGQYSSAIPQFEKAVALDTTDVTSLNNLGQTYKAAGRPADALKTWWQSLHIDSDQPHIRREYDALTPSN